MDQLLDMKVAGVTFDHLASVYEEYTGKIAVENLRPSWLIFSPGFRTSPVRLAAKRVLDVIGALVGLFIAGPAIAVLAVAIKLTSPGPVFFRQPRVGRSGRIGRFMRQTRFDELPQFWNVLRGDMSLVGPRPERPEFVQSLTRDIPFYGQRHVVKPGITGWAQVRYTYGATVEDAVEKLQYELYYIKHLSVYFDIFIIFETIKTVVMRAGH
jgi:lipopolysaccharide/colanic/teichoic acid biosynthesis glycosyltransferase